MAHNYTGLVKAVNTTNRDREAAAANQRQSDTPDDEFIHMIAEAAATMPAGFIEGPVEPTMLSIGELRNPGGLSGDDPDVRYVNGRVVRVKPSCRSNRGLR